MSVPCPVCGSEGASEQCPACRRADRIAAALVPEAPEHTVYGPAQCHPSRTAGVRAHNAPPGTEVTCPCGKRWRVTRGRAAGWERTG